MVFRSRFVEREGKSVNKKNLSAAYGGLTHDVGKPIQRSHRRSDLTEQEKQMTPFDSRRGFHSHLHAGYTSRFLRDQLGMYDSFEAQVSGHHLSDSRQLATWIRDADRISSAIDRKDNKPDDELECKNYKFQQVRLASIFREVDFGKSSQAAWFDLRTLSDLSIPNDKTVSLPDLGTSIEEYQHLVKAFIQEVEDSPELKNAITPYAYQRMYALFNKYMVSVPASTYEGGQTVVSLFDHSKLSSAIAASIAAGKEDSFRMLEFDISGIQKFIFKVTEGADTKQKVAKSLRGRSLMISLITDIVTMSYLHEFDMPQANIVFNTGGGALLLLPDSDEFETKAKHVSEQLQRDLFTMFGTDITFVWSSVQCNTEELQRFKTDKAIDLKAQLEEEKSRKYLAILGPEFFYRPARQSSTCELCGSLSAHSVCDTCQTILDLSDILIHHHDPVLLFFFDKELSKPKRDCAQLKLGNCMVWMTDHSIAARYLNDCDYIESINSPWMGQTRFIANSIPLNLNQEAIPLDEICETLIDPSWGDPKLGILKMDVDNLGSIFAYGLPSETRSLSKYLTLSRLLEVFFGRILVEICEDVSLKMNPQILDQTSNGTMFYINYAGGDDLVILGPAAGILMLTREIDQVLSSYVKNENITISAGIWIQNPKEPVRFGIQNAERMLECSKERADQSGTLQKNGVTLLDTTISFEEFGQVLDQARYWVDCINEKKYSRTGFYRLMKMIDAPNQNEFARRLPIMLYTLARNTKKELFRSEIQRRINEILPIADLQSESQFKVWQEKLLLEMKLAIMQTRN